jgi:bacterioferritin-associated ferredoxin
MFCCKGTNQGCGKGQQQSDHLVCTCMGVMYSEICSAIDQGAKTFQELSDQLGVGTGCSSCVAEVEAILKEKNRSGCCKS